MKEGVEETATIEGFSINLCTGPRIEDGCPFHFNARPEDGKVILNSLKGGEWGKEEKEKLPAKAGEEVRDCSHNVFLT